jgi:hypothetical protein
MNNNTGFELTQEQIDTIGKTASYLDTIGNFVDWCSKNVENIDLRESYSIMEDFVKSSEHIIQRIHKVNPQS